MNTTAKKPFTPAPRMNVLKDQLKEQRFGLITKVKALREQRQALKGVKGSGQQWAELCAQIDEVQDKIDLLSKSLGLPVKDRKEAMSGNVKPMAGRPVRVYAQGKVATEVASQVGEYRQGVNPSVFDAQPEEDYQSSPEDFK